MKIVPITQKNAKYFVQKHHRHHKPPLSSIFQIACENNDKICGVAIVGRPVARMLQDGYTLEVTRLCTDGTKNACSKLYSAAWRAAQSLGYRRLITYILNTEHGSSLRAANWHCIGKCGGGSWNRKDRPRIDTHPTQTKTRFEAKQPDSRMSLKFWKEIWIWITQN